MKILYVTTIGLTMCFFPEHIKMLLDEGHTVELACNDTESKVPEIYQSLNLKIHTIPFSRSPLSKSNVSAYKQLKKLVQEGQFDIVHTHTPNASAIVRLACRKLRKNGLKVFYTAHGFHFYKGAPILNWLVYYPVEKMCSRWTDTLITINDEDYKRANEHMKAVKVEFVPGVGLNLAKFGDVTVDINSKRKELGISPNAKIMLSVGELNENKNHQTVIKAIKDMDVYYIIAGIGNKRDELQTVIDAQGMTDRIKLLGHRTDVGELYAISDLFVFPSFREGLSVSLMEAMASGLPCAVSQIRGNTDLIDENGGVYFDPHDIADVRRALEQLDREHKEYGAYNKEKIRGFGNEAVLARLKDIYMPGTDRDSKAEQELSSVVQNG